MNVAIAGAGLVGRLLAHRLNSLGYKISLFDLDNPSGTQSCGIRAAGMICPLAEAETAEDIIVKLGFISLNLWTQILQNLKTKVFWQQQGSIIIAHRRDYTELNQLISLLQTKLDLNAVIPLNNTKLTSLEEELTNFERGLFLPQEAQIDNKGLFEALYLELKNNTKINWHSEKKVIAISPHTITLADKECKFDWVFDCRGLGAKVDKPDLRGVRGELIWLDAPEVNIKRPVRLMHPRYKIYIVPKENNVYAVGATSIESDDMSKISVRSSLELLSVAYSVHKGFSEARIIDTVVGCRPAFTNNLPQIMHQSGLTAINGLYRHGFLLAPAMIEQAVKLLTTGESDFAQLVT